MVTRLEKAIDSSSVLSRVGVIIVVCAFVLVIHTRWNYSSRTFIRLRSTKGTAFDRTGESSEFSSEDTSPDTKETVLSDSTTDSEDNARGSVDAVLPANVRVFMLLMQSGRVGSKFLGTLLGRCPSITLYGEVLNKYIAHRKDVVQLGDFDEYMSIENSTVRKQLIQEKWNSRQRVHDFVRYASQEYQKAAAANHTFNSTRLHWIGFQATSYHIERSRNIISALNPKVIHLIRRNRVKRAISYVRSDLVAKYCHSWHIRQGDNCELPTPWEMDETAFLNRLRRLERTDEADAAYYSSLQRSNVSVLEVSYEALSTRTADVFDEIAEFLGVSCDTSDSSTGSSDMVKIAPPSLRMELSNYDEIAATLKRPEYATQLVLSDEVLGKP